MDRTAEDDLADRVERMVARWADQPAMKELWRRGWAIVTSMERPAGAQALCDRRLRTIVLYAPWLQPQNDEALARTLRHEIAHALGFEHGAAMHELRL